MEASRPEGVLQSPQPESMPPLFSIANSFSEAGGYMEPGNFNADTIPDLVISLYLSNAVVLRLGSGNGAFAQGVTYFTGPLAYGMSVDDFNSDGKSDVAVSNEGDGVSILLGTGAGTFSVLPQIGLGTFTRFNTSGDFDADGTRDLAAGSPSLDRVYVFLGAGSGTFDPPVGYAVSELPYGIVAFDFDEDGDEDLVTANRTGGNLSFLRGNGDGSFEPATTLDLLFNVGRPSSLQHGDFDSDGHEDLLVGGDATVGVWLVHGNGDGTFQNATGTRTSPQGSPVNLVPEDFNGDGKPDVASAEAFSDLASILLGVGDGRFLSSPSVSILPPPSDPLAVAAADWDQDGWQDLAVSSAIGTFILLNQSPFPGSCQDLDGDGFGAPGDPSCFSGAVEDCDDDSAAISPLAFDACDGVDNDCNLQDGTDADLDGFTTCGGDCDDERSSIRPGRPERCNGVDDDCDGSIDEGFDNDGDGYTTCNSPLPDCNDNSSAINPGAVDLPGNSVDENCDGSATCDSLATWSSHGAFVQCVRNECDQAVAAGFLTASQCNELVRQAGKSNIGK